MSTLLNMENFCARAKQNKMMLKGTLLNIYFKLVIQFISLMKLKNDSFLKMQYAGNLFFSIWSEYYFEGDSRCLKQNLHVSLPWLKNTVLNSLTFWWHSQYSDGCARKRGLGRRAQGLAASSSSLTLAPSPSFSLWKWERFSCFVTGLLSEWEQMACVLEIANCRDLYKCWLSLGRRHSLFI